MYSQFRVKPTRLSEFAGLKLIVCAVITGICRYMTRDDGWRSQNEPYPGANCHVANDLLEYVVFNEAQIIPVYVIHLDLGKDVARYITNLSANTMEYIAQYRNQSRKAAHAAEKLYKEVLAPGDVKRKKEALFAQAQKYFPYGYGAASGSKFVVEAVGEVSEDEEEYGTYQKDRADADEGAADIWTGDGFANLALDGETERTAEEAEVEELDDADERSEAEDKVPWEYQMGPEGRTQFDEYYDARKAKVKTRRREPVY